MKITLTFNPSGLKSVACDLVSHEVGPKGLTVVVIDVLRACSTITHALSQGARAVYPFASVRECLRKAGELGQDKVILGGERGGIRIKGFQLGNSPQEYSREVVGGKDILFTTTNCTRNLQALIPPNPPLGKGGGGDFTARPKHGGFSTGNVRLVLERSGGEVLICSLLNLPAVADYLSTKPRSGRACSAFNSVHLALSGTGGEASLEDVVCGGMLIHNLIERCRGVLRYAPDLSDPARLAHITYLHYKDNPRQALLDSTHGRRLMELGMGRDIDFCAQVGIYPLIPRYLKGVIKEI